MKPDPGTYAIIFYNQTNTDVQIGRWGRLVIYPSYYIYVGSAFGPGGVKSRVLRHFKKTKRKHWHIDYLKELMKPMCAWYSYEPINQEHQWAQIVGEMNDTLPIKGFGCSDCRCSCNSLSARSNAMDG